MNYLSFCHLKKISFILPSLFEGDRIVNWQVFHFSFPHFEVIPLSPGFHCFWWEVSKSLIFFLCMWLPGYFKDFSIYLWLQKYDYNVSRNGFTCIFASWDLLSFWDLWIDIFHHMCAKIGHLVFKNTFSNSIAVSSASRTPVTLTFDHFILSLRSLGSIHFFSLCIFCASSSLISSSAVSNLLLIPFNKFISDIIIFTFRIFIW